MLKNEFQGAEFELFNANHSPGPLKFSITSGIQKVKENELKSQIFILNGAPNATRIQIPKDPKQSLGISHSFLVLQLFVLTEKEFSFEICFSDLDNTRRKVIFSTSTSEILLKYENPVAKIPLKIIKRNEWLNLCIDLSSFIALWRGKIFRTLDNITVTANCKLTKIFTMKEEPNDTSNDAELYKLPKTNRSTASSNYSIPRKFQLPGSIPCSTQLLNMGKLRLIEWTKPSQPQASSTNNHYSMRVGSGGSGEGSSRENSSRAGSTRMNNRTESSASSSTESVRHPGPALCPHPPSQPSSGDLKRRRIRVKSQQGALPAVSDASGVTVVRETRSAGMVSDLASDMALTPKSTKSQSAGRSGPRALKNERRARMARMDSQETAKAEGSFDSDSSELYYFRNPPRATSRESNQRSESIPAIHAKYVMHKSASVHCIQRGVSSNPISPPAPRKDEKDSEPVLRYRDNSNSRQSQDAECRVSLNRKSLREISQAEMKTKHSSARITQPLPSALTPSPRQPTIRGGPSKQKRNSAKAPLTMISISDAPATSSTCHKNVQTSPQPRPSDTTLNLQDYTLSDNISDSFEARMLLSLAQSDEDIAISNKSPRRAAANARSGTNPIARSYCDEEEDTVTNTITGSNPNHFMPVCCSGKGGPSPCTGCLKGETCWAANRDDGHLEEMRGALSSLMRSSQDEVSISLPLDHHTEVENEAARILSPPILLDDNKLQNHFLSTKSKKTSGVTSNKRELGEDQLELIYDPNLNCYYDPKTYKYYEIMV